MTGLFLKNIFLKTIVATNQLISILLIINIYGIEKLGVYSILIATIQICAQISGMGLNSYAQRVIPVGDLEKNTRLLIMQLSLVIICGTFVCLVLYKIHILINMQKELIYISIIMIYTSILNAILENTLNANKETVSASINIVIRVSWPILIMILYYKNHTLKWIDLMYVIIAFEIFAICISCVKIKKISSTNINISEVFNIGNIKNALKAGAIINSYSIIIVSTILVNRYVLGYWVSIEEVGIYFLLYQIIIFFPNLLESVYYSIELPKMVQLNRRKLKYVNEKYLMMMFFILIGNILIWYSYELMVALLNKNYLIDKKILLLFFFPISFLHFINRTNFYKVFVEGVDILILYHSIVIFTLLVLLSCVLTWLIGIEGSIISLNLSLLISIIIYKKIRIFPRNKLI